MNNRVYMASSLAIRLGIGLIVFVLMARGLGPQAFGLVAAVFAYATIASLLTDFGFSTKMLRDIGEYPERGGDILHSSLNIKISLCFLVLLVGGVGIALLPVSTASKLSCLFLGGGIIIASVGDLAMTVFRATNKFSKETKITVWTSLVHLVLVGPAALLTGGILWVALAFLVSRLIYAIAAVLGSLQVFPAIRFQPQSLWKTLRTMRGAWAWAADSGLGYLNGQIDILLVLHIFGLNAAGIYQAGARFVQVSLNVVTILSNVHIPSLASNIVTSSISKRELAIILEFILMGGFIALCFLFGGEWITKYCLGIRYAPVNILWPGFALFIFARYLSAVFGVVLTAFGAPITRVIGQCLGLIVIVMGFGFFLHGSVSAVPWIMAAGAVATSLCYGAGRIWMLYRPRSASCNATPSRYG